MTFKIKNPYESVMHLIGNKQNHYRTNLHAHSTVSDASVDYADMVKEYYKEGFDILAMTEHGINGKKWNEKPTEVPLYRYQYLLKRKKTPLTDEEFKQITEGTYKCEGMKPREAGRGMHCLTQGIELNMVTITKCHVNGFFTNAGLNNWGFENAFRYAVKLMDKAGGLSFINHPGDWTRAHKDIANAHRYENIRLFGQIFLDYASCVGTEVFNRVGNDTKNDRILWDEFIKYVVPHGKRNVFGFANSDSHVLSDVDTSFEDFILPEFSEPNMRTAMENGTFFAISRYAKNELGEDFKAEGAYPVVTDLQVDEENGVISLTAENAGRICWIADGKEIEEIKSDENGTLTCALDLEKHRDEISCYVRCQITGKGGITLTQPFICDDGNMARFIVPDTRTKKQKTIDGIKYNLKSIRIVVAVRRFILKQKNFW